MSPKDGLERVLGLVGLAFLLNKLGEEDTPLQSDSITQPQHNSPPKRIDEPLPRYHAYDSDYGLVIEIDGYKLGSLLAQPFFRKDWIEKHPGSLEVILAAERIAQDTLKISGSRTNSGAPGYDHIRRVMQKITESAEAIGIELDGATTIPTVLHDEIEGRVKALENLWKIYTVLARYEKDAKLRYMYEILRDKSGLRLTERRIEIRDELEERLTSAIPEYIKGPDRQKNRRDIEKGTFSVRRLTRDANRYTYPESMEFEFSRYGNEGLDQTYRRAAIKFNDGTSNMEETDPLARATLEQIALAGKDTNKIGRFNVGQELTERFGSVNLEAKSMVPSVMVQTAFIRVFPFHYFNETDSKDGEDVLKSRDQETINMRRIALHSRDVAIDTAVRLLGRAKKEFEERPEIKEYIPIVDEYIRARLGGDFFDKVTWGGVIMPLMEYDVRGKEFIEKHDNIAGGIVGEVNVGGMRFMYQAARVLEVLIPKFKMYYDRTPRRSGIQLTLPGFQPLIGDTSKFDVYRHRWFTLGNMHEALKLMPSLQDMISEYHRYQNGK